MCPVQSNFRRRSRPFGTLAGVHCLTRRGYSNHAEGDDAPKRSGAVAAPPRPLDPARLGARRAHPCGRSAGRRPGPGDPAPSRSAREHPQSQLTVRHPGHDRRGVARDELVERRSPGVQAEVEDVESARRRQRGDRGRVGLGPRTHRLVARPERITVRERDRGDDDVLKLEAPEQVLEVDERDPVVVDENVAEVDVAVQQVGRVRRVSPQRVDVLFARARLRPRARCRSAVAGRRAGSRSGTRARRRSRARRPARP